MSNNTRKILVTGGSGFIGTNYIAYLQREGSVADILNLDSRAPQCQQHGPYWRSCDITDLASLKREVIRFKPTHILHLAARTDTDSAELSDYQSNIEGNRNLLQVIKNCGSVERVIVTSTQFVKRPGSFPNHDTDFDPHTAYGESKVICEQETRSSELNCPWTIVRPTNIWGPWHPRYPSEFWRVLDKGLYFHPGGKSTIRSYGFVDNVVYQLESIFNADADIIDEKVFYVGDESLNLIDWVNGFSYALKGKKVRIVPRWLIQSLGWFGDALAVIGITFPITTSRYRSMTTDDIVPIDETIRLFGPPPFSLQQGVDRTVSWLRQTAWAGK